MFLHHTKARDLVSPDGNERGLMQNSQIYGNDNICLLRHFLFNVLAYITSLHCGNKFDSACNLKAKTIYLYIYCRFLNASL